MKAYSKELELTAVRIISTKSRDVKPHAERLLARLDESYFHTTEAAECFSRMKHLASTVSYIPTFKELVTDPAISEETRQVLKITRLSKEDVLHNDIGKSVDSLFDNLLNYRRTRLLYEVGKKASEELKKDNPDIIGAVDRISEILSEARAQNGASAQLIHFGTQNNSTQLMNELLDGDAAPVIRTGFDAFDNTNGGFFKGSLVVIGAPTSHGKSAMANQLLVNQASLGYSVSMVPLEMTAQEMTARLMSNVTNVDSLKFLLKKLTDNEKTLVRKRMKKWIRRVKEVGGRYTIFDPNGDVSIEDVCLSLRPYNYDVILIDYISLLSGVDGDDSWRELGKVARWAKVFAKTNDVLVILLAQINEDGVLRYSKTIGDHANNVIYWNFDEEAKETGVVTIRQKKARNQRLFDFKLKVDFSVMSFRDLTEEDYDELGHEGLPDNHDTDHDHDSDVPEYLDNLGDD